MGERVFIKVFKTKNHVYVCDYSLSGVRVLTRRSKRQKPSKLGTMTPKLRDLVPFVVVMRKGCEGFGGVRLGIFNIDWEV